jgi:hypothetical protein
VEVPGSHTRAIVRTAEATVHATVTTASKKPPLGFTCTCPDLNDLPADERSVDPLCPHHGGRCAVAPIPQQPAIGCKLCDEHGGFEGDLHRPATVRVILLRRPDYDGGQATDAGVSLLCLPTPSGWWATPGGRQRPPHLADRAPDPDPLSRTDHAVDVNLRPGRSAVEQLAIAATALPCMY